MDQLFLGLLVIIIGVSGICFMLSCIRHRALSTRNLVIGGVAAFVNFGLFLLLAISVLAGIH